MNRLTLFLSSLAIASPVFLAAESVVNEGVVVITGTLTQQPSLTSVVPVQVIDREQITATQAADLAELLSLLPSLQIQEQHGQQGQTISMQGMNPEHVLVMINGKPVTQTSGELNIERLNLANVTRIEIAPGSGSALYGSSAMAGVINLITETPTEAYQRFSLGVKQAENSFERLPTSATIGAHIGTPIGKLYVDSHLSITRYSGFNAEPTTWEEQIASGYRWSWVESID